MDVGIRVRIGRVGSVGAKFAALRYWTMVHTFAVLSGLGCDDGVGMREHH